MLMSYGEYIPVFKAISDETRLRIIDILSCGEMCACDILGGLDISQSTLSYHMKTLTNCGIVDAKPDGNWMIYTLNKEKLEESMSFIRYLSNEKDECICKKM